jgi:hypothetical protein
MRTSSISRVPTPRRRSRRLCRCAVELRCSVRRKLHIVDFHTGFIRASFQYKTKLGFLQGPNDHGVAWLHGRMSVAVLNHIRLVKCNRAMFLCLIILPATGISESSIVPAPNMAMPACCGKRRIVVNEHCLPLIMIQNIQGRL